MLKNINPDILIGLLVASLFWVGVFVWQSSRPPNHASAASQTCEGTKNECAKATTDERIADYTWWLAVLTAALVTVSAGQGFFLLRADRTARIAANAADLSARAAVAIELPIIRVVPEDFGYGSFQDGSNLRIENCSLGSLAFMNLGRTKAFPIEVRCGWTVGDRLPDVPVYTFTKSFPTNLIFEPGPNTTEHLHISEFELEFAPGVPEKARINAVGLWFYCSVAYLDFMQNRHEVGFCWRRWDVTTSAWFREDATPAYSQKT
jgi:hypothetical protein